MLGGNWMIKSGLKWMSLIIGTTIGAGYASGRELWQFFGEESGLAIFLFGFIFSICCFVIMKISFEKKTVHFHPVLQALVGKRLSYFYDIVIIVYLFTTTVVMLAGGGATLQAFHFPYQLGIGLFCLSLVLLFIWDLKGIVSINVFIIPLLILGLLAVLFMFLTKNGGIAIDIHSQKNWPAAFTFTSLNILPLVAVLSAIGSSMKHIGEAYIASIGSGLVLGIISFIYNEALLKIAHEMLLYEIPLFAILKHYPSITFIFMSILLWMAIYTTAASGVLGIITRFQNSIKLPLWLLALCTLVSMIPFTTFGFGTLVAILYPLYGIVNLYLLVAILLYPIATKYKWD